MGHEQAAEAGRKRGGRQWVAAQTSGDKVCFSDGGNLAIYDSSGGVIWESGTLNQPDASKNKLVLDDAVPWETKTDCY